MKKKKIVRDIELSIDERSLIVEALNAQFKRVREDMFYKHQHPQAFYEIYLRRYSDLISKLDYTLPKSVKLPRF